MLKSKLLLLSTALCLAAGVRAETAGEGVTEAAIKITIEHRLQGAKVESVKPTPYSGLYELRIGDQIYYTDKTAQYFIEGSVINTKTMENLTKARIDELNKIKFADLPLELAIKTVKGNGKRVMALFEDPNCPYCKRLHQQALKTTDNVTVYTFLYNILSEDSSVKSKNIWCSADRNKSWDEWMVNGKAAPAAPASCTTPNEKVFALGQKLRISGTPSIFFADGSRIPGAVDTKTLESKFATIK